MKTKKLQTIAQKGEEKSKRIWGMLMYENFGSTTNWDIHKLLTLC